jgi:hypothetical protein
MGHGRVVAFAYDEHEVWFDSAFGEGDKDYLPLSDPNGVTVMRSVCVIGDRVFVPGHIENAIAIYNLDGEQFTVVSGLLPLWNHTLEPVHSVSDFVYGALEDVVFVGPYQICAADGEPDVYFISEPFASSVIKVRIPRIKGEEDALLIESVGQRRDDQNRLRETSQFNCMTSVIGFKRERRTVPREAVAGSWFDQWASATTSVYKYWYDQFFTATGIDPLARMTGTSLNIDSGNWCMKTFNTESDPYHQLQDMMRGFFVPGDLAMDVYYPQTPPLADPADRLCRLPQELPLELGQGRGRRLHAVRHRHRRPGPAVRL